MERNTAVIIIALSVTVAVILIIGSILLLSIYPNVKTCKGSYVIQDIAKFEVVECEYELKAKYESVASESGMYCYWAGSYYKCEKTFSYANPRDDPYRCDTCKGRDESKTVALAEVAECLTEIRSQYSTVELKPSTCERKGDDYLCFQIVWYRDFITSCGNNILETGEECDDGNTINGDGCDSTCHFESPVAELTVNFMGILQLSFLSSGLSI